MTTPNIDDQCRIAFFEWWHSGGRQLGYAPHIARHLFLAGWEAAREVVIMETMEGIGDLIGQMLHASVNKETRLCKSA